MKLNKYKLLREGVPWEVNGEAISPICVRLMLDNPLQSQALMQNAGGVLAGIINRNGEWRQERWKIVEIIPLGEIPDEATPQPEVEIDRCAYCDGEIVSYKGMEFCPCGYCTTLSGNEVPVHCFCCGEKLEDGSPIFLVPYSQNGGDNFARWDRSNYTHCFYIDVRPPGALTGRSFEAFGNKSKKMATEFNLRHRPTRSMMFCKKCYEAIPDDTLFHFKQKVPTSEFCNETPFTWSAPNQHRTPNALWAVFKGRLIGWGLDMSTWGYTEDNPHSFSIPLMERKITIPFAVYQGEDFQNVAMNTFGPINNIPFFKFMNGPEYEEQRRRISQMNLRFNPCSFEVLERPSTMMVNDFGQQINHQMYTYRKMHTSGANNNNNRIMLEAATLLPVVRITHQALSDEKTYGMKYPKIENRRKKKDEPKPEPHKFMSYPTIGVEIEGHNIDAGMRNWAMTELSWRTVGDGSVRGNHPCEVLTNPMGGKEVEDKMRLFYHHVGGHNIQHVSAGAHVNIDNDSVAKSVALMVDEFSQSKSRSTPMALMKKYMGGALQIVRVAISQQRRRNSYCAGGFAYRGKDQSDAQRKSKLTLNGVSYPTIALRYRVFEFRAWPSTSNVDIMLARMEISQKIIAKLNEYFYEYIRSIVDPMSDKQKSNRRGEINGRINAFVDECEKLKQFMDGLPMEAGQVNGVIDKIMKHLKVSRASTEMFKRMVARYNVFGAANAVQEGGQRTTVPNFPHTFSVPDSSYILSPDGGNRGTTRTTTSRARGNPSPSFQPTSWDGNQDF